MRLMCVVGGRVVPLPVVILHPDCTLASPGDVGRLACRGGGRSNRGSARKPIQTRPGRLPTHAAWPRASNHPRRRPQPGPFPKGDNRPDRSPLLTQRGTRLQSRLPGEGPPQVTGVREAQPATARRHCEPAEGDERSEEAGVRRGGGRPWLGLALTVPLTCAGTAPRCGLAARYRPMLALARSLHGLGLLPRRGPSIVCREYPATGICRNGHPL